MWSVAGASGSFWAQSWGAGQLWDCLFTKTTRYKAALGTHIMDGSRSHQVSREWGFQQSLVNVVPGARSVLVSVR